MSIRPGDEYSLLMEKEIPGIPEYVVTDDGEVISTKFGKRRVLKPYAGAGTSAHPRVRLTPEGMGQKTFLVHQLVAQAFLPPRPAGHELRHLNGDHRDCRADNLAWGTRSENVLDQVKHGVHNNARKTHCKNGHPFDEENTLLRYGRRRCLACQRRSQQGYKDRHSVDTV